MLNLRRVDVQAKVAFFAAILSIMVTLALAYFVLKGLHWETKIIPYSSKSNRMLGVLGTGGLSLVIGAIGFWFGLTSAGQRRNEQQVLSWLGFFLSAMTITASAVLLTTFMLWRERVI